MPTRVNATTTRTERLAAPVIGPGPDDEINARNRALFPLKWTNASRDGERAGGMPLPLRPIAPILC